MQRQQRRQKIADAEKLDSDTKAFLFLVLE